MQNEEKADCEQRAKVGENSTTEDPLNANNQGEIYCFTTKSGLKVEVSFASGPIDYERLAKFFLLLSEKPQK